MPPYPLTYKNGRIKVRNILKRTSSINFLGAVLIRYLVCKDACHNYIQRTVRLNKPLIRAVLVRIRPGRSPGVIKVFALMWPRSNSYTYLKSVKQIYFHDYIRD